MINFCNIKTDISVSLLGKLDGVDSFSSSEGKSQSCIEMEASAAVDVVGDKGKKKCSLNFVRFFLSEGPVAYF